LREKRSVRLLMDGAVLIAIFLGVNAWQSRGHLRGEAPVFELRVLDASAGEAASGERVSNVTLTGKPTMVVFWAPWCGVCKADSPAVSRVKSIVGDRANVVSIASEYESLRDVQRYVDDVGVDYPVLLGGKKTARDFQVRAFPTVFFLDSDGRIDSSVVGYTTTAGMLARLML
jgi:thiol-disulfide isomerase/thioredoxin